MEHPPPCPIRRWIMLLVVALVQGRSEGEPTLRRLPCDFLPSALWEAGCECWHPHRPRVICHDLGRTNVPDLPESMAPTHTLYITGNNFGDLTTPQFTQLDSLNRLILTEDGITDIGDGVFAGVEDTLKWLDLSDNELSEVPRAVTSLANLEDLYLSFNQISTLPARAFSNLNNLRALALEGNRISLVSKSAFATLENLLHLEITLYPTYRFRNFPTDDIPQLESLIILNSEIDFSRAASVLQSLRNLNNVGLIGSRHADNHESVKKFLQHLNGENIQYLNLANNSLVLKTSRQTPQNQLSSMTNLLALDLSENRIEKIGSRAVQFLSNMPALQRLDLHGNQIASFRSSVMDHLPALQLLDLSDNQLTSLDFGTAMNSFHQDLELRVGNNPWHCDCELRWLFQMMDDFLSGSHGHLVAEEVLYTLRCASPPSLAGQLMKDIDFDTDVCPSTTTTGRQPTIDDCNMMILEEHGIGSFDAYMECLNLIP